MTQRPLPIDNVVDIEAGRRLRDEGIEAVCTPNAQFLHTARAIAVALCRVRGTITADDVRREWDTCGFPQPTHPNAWGGLFRGETFEPTGEFRQSSYVSRRGGMQRVWRLARV